MGLQWPSFTSSISGQYLNVVAFLHVNADPGVEGRFRSAILYIDLRDYRIMRSCDVTLGALRDKDCT